MHIHQPSWRSRLVVLGAALSLAVATVVPAIAASPTRGVHKSSHAKPHASYSCPTGSKKPSASGTIKYSDWQFPDTLNFWQTGASVSQETIDSLIENLVMWSGFSKGKSVLLPDLLQSIPKGTNGGRVFKATLKKGLRWSDGREITARDVKFGWQTAMDNASGPFCPSVGCDVISRIDTSGKYGITFRLKSPYAPFVGNVLQNIPVFPTSWPGTEGWKANDVPGAANKVWQDTAFNYENDTFPTNGPYQVQTFAQNDRIALKPMKYYHTMSCGARVKNLLFVFYSSKPGMIAAAAAKQTDSTTNYTLADLSTLRKNKTYKTDVYPAYEFEHLTLNIDANYHGKPNPLHDRNVRLALALSLDKLGMIQSALGLSKADAQKLVPWTFLINTPQLNFVQPFADTKLKGAWDPYLNKGKGGWITSTGTGQALADAKKLIAKSATCASGCDLDGVTTSGNPVRQAEFAVMLKNWARIGVRYHPGYIPASKLFSDWNKGAPPHTGDFQIAMWTDVGYPDPDAFKPNFDSHFIDREKTTHSAANVNFVGAHDPLLDKAFRLAARTLDNKVRQKWYNVIQEQVAKQAYWIELYFRPELATEDGRIGNFSPNPTNLANEWDTFQWFPKGSS